MHYSQLFVWMAAAGTVHAMPPKPPAHGNGAPKPGKDGKYSISAPGIKAEVCIYRRARARRAGQGGDHGADKRQQFIPYGATLTNLFVKDKQGKDVDVVLGYDDVDFYRRSPRAVAPSPFGPSLSSVSNDGEQPRTPDTRCTTRSQGGTSTASGTGNTTSTARST